MPGHIHLCLLTLLSNFCRWVTRRRCECMGCTVPQGPSSDTADRASAGEEIFWDSDHPDGALTMGYVAGPREWVVEAFCVGRHRCAIRLGR